MNKEAQFKKFFQFTSIVTDLFPVGGAKFLDATFQSLLGNSLVLKTVAWQVKRRLNGVKGYNRFLVVADLNIGDAVIAQGAVSALKEIFPDAEIDCVIKKSTKDIVEGNPNISNLYPVYIGAPFPIESDLTELARIAESKDYDLIINLSPMIDDKTFTGKRVVNYSMIAAELVRNEAYIERVNNIVHQAHTFIGNVFGDFLPPDFGRRFKGVQVYLSDSAVESAGSFLSGQEVPQESPIVMFNPDASARFTRMPFDFQLNLLRRLADFDCTILLGGGHVEKYIEHDLMYTLSPNRRRKVVIIPPSTKLDVYTALVDFADVYISGDTGPLHLAAARKFLRGSGESLRNRTAVFSVFGGTPPRIYGYDSKSPGFFPANQDALSRAFIARTSCRNITCINKMAKTCKEVRCFVSLNPDEVAYEIVAHLETVRMFYNRERLRIVAK